MLRDGTPLPVACLTKLPIIADVAIASNKAKGKADIVVHENQNNQMEEIFRSWLYGLCLTSRECRLSLIMQLLKRSLRKGVPR